MKTDKWKKIFLISLGFYLFLTGIFAAIFLFPALISADDTTRIKTLIFFYPYFIFLMFTGVILIVINDSPKAIRLAIINQAFQVIYFKVLGFMYYNVCGSYLVLGIVNNDEFQFYHAHGLMSVDTIYHFGDAPDGYGLGVNLVPIAIIILLYIIYKQNAVKKNIQGKFS